MNKAVVNGMQITSSLDAEELAFIGDMSLDTTADTLSGAINEHESDITTLNSNLNTETAYTSSYLKSYTVALPALNANNITTIEIAVTSNKTPMFIGIKDAKSGFSLVACNWWVTSSTSTLNIQVRNVSSTNRNANDIIVSVLYAK